MSATTTNGPVRGSEEYLVLLERRIKEQRDHIARLTALRETGGNKYARRKIVALERSLGRATLAIDHKRESIEWFVAQGAKEKP